MALGAVTLVAASKAPGPIRHDVVTIVGDSAYPTGGTAIDAAVATALGVLNYDILAVVPTDSKGYQLAYIRATGKLLVRTGDYNPAADSPFTEVANAVDLSGVTFEVMIVSQ